MPRSRSRSPRRDRRNRSRSRERRDRDSDRHRPRRRDYDRHARDDEERRERGFRRSRTPDLSRNKIASGSAVKSQNVEKKKFTAEDFAGKTEEEIEMMKLMGFGNFDTTKGKKVEGNDAGAVHVKLKRNYRQYMNRRGGFNRPLDAVH